MLLQILNLILVQPEYFLNIRIQTKTKLIINQQKRIFSSGWQHRSCAGISLICRPFHKEEERRLYLFTHRENYPSNFYSNNNTREILQYTSRIFTTQALNLMKMTKKTVNAHIPARVYDVPYTASACIHSTWISINIFTQPRLLVVGLS